MRYAVINSKRENGEYKREWIKTQTLQEAKDEVSDHLKNDDYSEIYVPYDEYKNLLVKLENMKEVLDEIGAMASGCKVFKYIDKEVLEDI